MLSKKDYFPPPSDMILCMVHFYVGSLHILDQIILCPAEEILEHKTFLNPYAGKDRVDLFNHRHVCSVALRDKSK